jgi:hypothetical protein
MMEIKANTKISIKSNKIWVNSKNRKNHIPSVLINLKKNHAEAEAVMAIVKIH